MKKWLNILFGVRGIVSVQSICDQIHNEWMVYQNENIPESFSMKADDEVGTRSDRENNDF